MKEKKQSFYRDLISSIKDFDKYPQFAMRSVNNGVKYLLKLLLLIVIAVSIAFTIKAGQTINNTISYIKNESPYFKYENNTLHVDSKEPLIYENTEQIDGIIIIDTNQISEETQSEYDKKFALYNNGVLLLKDKVIIKNEMFNELITQTYEEIFASYNINNFDKAQIIQYFTNSKIAVICISIFISLFIIFIMIYLFELLLELITPLIFGYFSSRIVGIGMKIPSLFNITVHAMTLSTILRIIYIIVNLFTGFYIKYFDIMYITIIYIYIITALFIIRSGLIKQQIELMKIVEEQKNVKKQIEEEKEKEENDKQEEDKKDSKKENEDNNIGKEVNGEV